MAVVAFELAGTNSAVGLVQVGIGLSMLILGPIGGVVADRVSKKPMVLCGQSVIAVSFIVKRGRGTGSSIATDCDRGYALGLASSVRMHCASGCWLFPARHCALIRNGSFSNDSVRAGSLRFHAAKQCAHDVDHQGGLLRSRDVPDDVGMGIPGRAFVAVWHPRRRIQRARNAGDHRGSAACDRRCRWTRQT